MAEILIIDDDMMVCEILSSYVRNLGHEAAFALSLSQGVKEADSGRFDVVFLDINLPDGDGLSAIPKIQSTSHSPDVVIITGKETAHSARIAMENGAWDYIRKPFSTEGIKLTLSRVFQYRKEKEASGPSKMLRRERIIGDSPALTACLELAANAGSTDVSVLLTGETGTGKELLARAIHGNSRRSGGPFVVVDCAALPESLVESTLFGHVKGAFTGADVSKEGLVREADGGTLFLDEVAELPLSLQSAFLRVLQEHRFRPVGGGKEVTSNFRLIAATNREPEEMVRNGTFRSDLLYRLKSMAIHLPPLRERNGDVVELTVHYLKLFCDRYGIGLKGVSREFLEALGAYDWPGNVRELVNTIERAVSVGQKNKTLYPIHLPAELRSRLLAATPETESGEKSGATRFGGVGGSFPKLKEVVEEAEEQYFLSLIAHTDGDLKEICRISGLSRANVYLRFKKYNLSRK